MTSLAIAVLLLSTPAPGTGPDPLFETTVACAIDEGALVLAAPADPATVSAPAADRPAPRSLVLAAESRVGREDPSQQSIGLALRVDRLTAPSPRSRLRLASPGRAWPFALAATADAATTYWALARGGSERNPVLALGRLDVGMVKIVQFPLLAKALDVIEARHPRLGRRLRWTTLVFHAVLAFNNVRLGRGAAQRDRMTSASGTP